MKHDKSSPSVSEDIDLYNALVTRPYTMKNGMHLPENDPIHASPAEHVATPMEVINWWIDEGAWEEGVSHIDRRGDMWSGNFKGWLQYRQLI
jgi:hypothetical protein